MSELRKDPIVGRWVIISEERGKRPSDWASKSNLKPDDKMCPFCPGNENRTPTEIMTVTSSKSQEQSLSSWDVRVVPNKFPALSIEGDLERRGYGNYDMMNGVGAHEVIIETPDHEKGFAALEVEEIFEILNVYRARIMDLKKDKRLTYVLIFKNHGEAAGASLEHSHSQLIATPIIPKRVIEELEGSKLFYDMKERCIFCDLIQQEIQLTSRIVSIDEHYLVVEPFAPRFPYETWILPREHFSHFENMGEKSCFVMAQVLRDTLCRINLLLDYPSYNFILHTSPVQRPNLQEYHWHLEIIPRLTKIAGFEWGSGFYINQVPPERAASELKSVELIN